MAQLFRNNLAKLEYEDISPSGAVVPLVALYDPAYASEREVLLSIKSNSGSCTIIVMSEKNYYKFFAPVHTTRVITLCGSTKFKEDFVRVQEKFTLEGNVVISVGLFGHADNKFGTAVTEEVKEKLDELHKRKIDMSDEIFVINKGGYIGESTRSEIEYAKKHNKIIKYMEEI